MAEAAAAAVGTPEDLKRAGGKYSSRRAGTTRPLPRPGWGRAGSWSWTRRRGRRPGGVLPHASRPPERSRAMARRCRSDASARLREDGRRLLAAGRARTPGTRSPRPPRSGARRRSTWWAGHPVRPGNRSSRNRPDPIRSDRPRTAAPTEPGLPCVYEVPDPRVNHTAVWTGTEMIVWGGEATVSSLDTGGRYNPATDTWTPTRDRRRPVAALHHTAVWTGTEMIVWGGYDRQRLARTRRPLQPRDRPVDADQSPARTSPRRARTTPRSGPAPR